MRSRETWALLVGAALITAGCTSAPAETTISTPVTTTSTPSTTTTEPVPTSTTSAPSTTTTTIAVRLPANDVDDPTEAIVAISDYFSYLFTIPDLAPGYLDLIYLETCDCYEPVMADLARYANNGWAQDDQGLAVVDVEISQQFSNGNVLLEVTDTWSPQYVVDASGERIRLEADEWVGLVSLIGLERGSDGRWRIAVVGELGYQEGSTS